ncbi:MAG: hypothetical protein QGI05_04240 [Candidatus Omnitrophota bacterium]|nr:hypothetical protein [Candidatus Omnitrophota bacterium]
MRKVIFCIVYLLIPVCVFAQKSFQYTSDGRRDPFVPLVSKDGKYLSDAYGIKGIRDIRLEGIVWDGGESSAAIINGEIVSVGEKIGTVKILKIEEHSVVFDVNGKEVSVDLTEE